VTFFRERNEIFILLTTISWDAEYLDSPCIHHL